MLAICHHPCCLISCVNVKLLLVYSSAFSLKIDILMAAALHAVAGRLHQLHYRVITDALDQRVLNQVRHNSVCNFHVIRQIVVVTCVITIYFSLSSLRASQLQLPAVIICPMGDTAWLELTIRTELLNNSSDAGGYVTIFNNYTLHTEL